MKNQLNRKIYIVFNYMEDIPDSQGMLSLTTQFEKLYLVI